MSTLSATQPAPAFKEWAVIVEALGRGVQILILRKGGIAEGRQGFQIKHNRFWLFPTQFHQQLERTKPAAAAYSAPADPALISLQYFADIADVRYLDEWDKIAALTDSHLWRDEIIRERFDYGGETGLHAILVRVHQLESPILLQPSKSYEGCKSWIEVPATFGVQPSKPVLGDSEFNTRREELLARLG